MVQFRSQVNIWLILQEFLQQESILLSFLGRREIRLFLLSSTQLYHHQFYQWWLDYTHTPQQNGVAERKHRHLIQITLALLSQSGLSLSYWSYAIATACHLINKLPTPLLNMSSPWDSCTMSNQISPILGLLDASVFPYSLLIIPTNSNPKPLPASF
jgi:hypothetical protein